MSTPERRRRLAAIMYTDMVGFTALGQRDEELSLQLLQAQRELVRPILAQHRGREVKTIGDAFLVEFSSALDAVRCAADVQQKVREFDSSAPDGRRMQLRIGIHLGDIVEDGEDISGDAVNVASRVYELAEGGGISVTRQVYDMVANKSGLQFSSLGFRQLKNVRQPVEAFAVTSTAGTPGLPRPTGALDPRRIAVLPLANLSPDPGDEYFADGLTEELISRMSAVAGLQVISRTSSMHYKKTDKTTGEIARELNSKSILEGSVRKSGDKVRVSVQLIDGETDTHVWAGNYDRRLEDVFSIQGDIAESVVGSMKLKLLPAEEARLKSEETQDAGAFVAYLKGRSLMGEATEEATHKAKAQFETAIKLDPGYAKAYAGMADAVMALGDYLFSPVPTAMEEARKCVDRALSLDPDLAEARVSLGNILLYDYKFTQAEEEFRRALELNPSYATAHQWYSACLQALGRETETIDEVLVAEKLDPLSPAITLSVIYRTAYRGMFDEAERRLKKLQQIDPESPHLDEARMVMAFAKKDWAAALVSLEKMKQRDASDPYLDADFGYIYAVTGKRDQAMKVVEDLKKVPEEQRIKGNLISFVYLGLGDLDSAYDWLYRAASWKEMFAGWVRATPMFSPVREDPRFPDLMRRMGVPVG